MAPGTGPTAGGGGMGGPAGPYVTTPRGPTSRTELKIAWDLPTYTETIRVKAGETVALPVRHALAQLNAFAEIAGDDHRPLLVMRECLKCNGTDDALMTRKQDNLCARSANFVHGSHNPLPLEAGISL